MSALADEGTIRMNRKITYDPGSTPTRMRLNELMEEVETLKADVAYWQSRCVKAETDQEKIKLRNEGDVPPTTELLEDKVVAFNHALKTAEVLSVQQYESAHAHETELAADVKVLLRNDPLPMAEWMGTIIKGLENARIDFLDKSDKVIIESDDDETNAIVNRLEQAIHRGELTGLSIMTAALADACIQLLSQPNLIADAIMTACENGQEPPLHWIERLRSLVDEHSLEDTEMVRKALMVTAHFNARKDITQERWCRDFGEQFDTKKPSDLRRYISVRNKVEKIRTKKN